MMEPLVDCLIEDARWDGFGLGPLAQAAALAVLKQQGLDPVSYCISLLGCNDARIAVLNADFRGKPQPTNVLSWPSDERGAEKDGAAPKAPSPGAPEMPDELGDIAIAWETCAREAAEAGRPMPDHVTHLLVHATLHLLGFDHTRPKDAALMEAIEVAILAKMGISNPYE